MRAALSAVGATSREGHRTELRKAISWLPRVGEPPKPVKFCFLDKDVGGTMGRRACPRGDAWPGSAPFFVAMHASYGPDFNDQYRRAAHYIDRILLKGEKPGDLPVHESSHRGSWS